MYSILSRYETNTDIASECSFYNECYKMKEDFKNLTETYLNPRWVSARNDETCHRTEPLRKTYQRLIAAIQQGNNSIIKMTEYLSLELDIPYFIIRSVLRERYWTSTYFQTILRSSNIWPGLELCYLIYDVLPEPVKIFGSVKWMRLYREIPNGLERSEQTLTNPRCIIINTNTITHIHSALDKTVFLITNQGHILDVGRNPEELYEKYFDYLRKQYENLHRSLRWRDYCFGWIFGDCTGVRAETSVSRNSPCLVIIKHDKTEQSIALARRYYDVANSVERNVILRRLLTNLMQCEFSENIMAVFGEELKQAARIYRFTSHPPTPLICSKTFYSELLEYFDPQILGDFIIGSIDAKGYEYAVSFLFPLIDSKKTKINPHFCLHFLSKLTQNQSVTKNNISECRSRLFPNIQDTKSSFHHEILDICDEIPQMKNRETSYLSSIFSPTYENQGYNQIPLFIVSRTPEEDMITSSSLGFEPEYEPNDSPKSVVIESDNEDDLL
jgi:hypothetical protein